MEYTFLSIGRHEHNKNYVLLTSSEGQEILRFIEQLLNPRIP